MSNEKSLQREEIFKPAPSFKLPGSKKPVPPKRKRKHGGEAWKPGNK
jgi:hypothetical protein